MTGPSGHRVYLDWNASAPLRPEARAAMLAAMDAVGNPSSVHAEGRAARAIVERARAQLARLAGCEPSDVVFTSGATEAAALAMRGHATVLVGATEHDAIWETARERARPRAAVVLTPDADGRVGTGELDDRAGEVPMAGALVAIAAANGETGVVQALAPLTERARATGAAFLADAAQTLGKMRLALGAADFLIASGHKIGGPAGVGALIVRGGIDLVPLLRGGGQEQGRRSGTENVIGIAGFGAAAEAARRDLEEGAWERVARLRDALEERLESAAPDLILVGKGAPRLPNTSCFAVPGWAGETQVMQMDLGGFAVSAGSACSSGKVARASRVLRAMGFGEVMAASAIRVSLGPTTGETDVAGFAEAWIDRYRRRNSRAA